MTIRVELNPEMEARLVAEGLSRCAFGEVGGTTSPRGFDGEFPASRCTDGRRISPHAGRHGRGIGEIAEFADWKLLARKLLWGPARWQGRRTSSI